MSTTSVVPDTFEVAVVDFLSEPFTDAVVVSVVDFPAFGLDPGVDFVGFGDFAVAPGVSIVFLDPPTEGPFAGFGAETFGAPCVFIVVVVGFEAAGGFGFDPPLPRWAKVG